MRNFGKSVVIFLARLGLARLGTLKIISSIKNNSSKQIKGKPILIVLGIFLIVTTTPLLAKDSDNDGISDTSEINLYGTDPNNPDTDFDTLTDGEEILLFCTDPLDNDTDSDNLTDDREISSVGTDPNNPDTDSDTLTDGKEVDIYLTDPLSSDFKISRLSLEKKLFPSIQIEWKSVPDWKYKISVVSDGVEHILATRFLSQGEKTLYYDRQFSPTNSRIYKITLLDPIESNCLHFWDFDNDAKDQINQADGTEHGEVIYTPGLNNKHCATFINQNDSYIKAQGVQSEKFRSGYTITTWLNTDCTGGDYHQRGVFASLPINADSMGIYFEPWETEALSVGPPSLNGINTDFNHRKTIRIGQYITAGQWAHYAETYSYKTNIFKVYINGKNIYSMDCRPFESSFFAQSLGIAIQGICSDGNYIYVGDSGRLGKYDLNGNNLIFVKLSNLGHNGDHCVVGDYLYIPYVKIWGDPDTDCGIARYNKSDLTIDTSFGSNGVLNMNLITPDKDLSAICFDGEYFYVSGYTNKIHKFDFNFNYIKTISLDLVASVSGTGEWHRGMFDSGICDGITYDPVLKRFHLTYHGNLAFSINDRWEHDSIVYYKPLGSGFKVACQGIDWVSTSYDGRETFWIADRNWLPHPNSNAFRKITRLPASDEYSIGSDMNGIIIGAGAESTASDKRCFHGKVQDFKIYEVPLSEGAIRSEM